jgi:hypothetical protein
VAACFSASGQVNVCTANQLQEPRDWFSYSTYRVRWCRVGVRTCDVWCLVAARCWLANVCMNEEKKGMHELRYGLEHVLCYFFL